jgi:hypothetical protein
MQEKKLVLQNSQNNLTKWFVRTFGIFGCCVLRQWFETKGSVPASRVESVFFLQNALAQNSESLLLFLFHGKEFRVVFSSTEWFGAEFQVFAYLYLSSTEGNSGLIFLPRNGSERNSESLFLFLFHGTELWAFFSSAEVSDRNSESFLFRSQPECHRNKPIVYEGCLLETDHVWLRD